MARIRHPSLLPRLEVVRNIMKVLVTGDRNGFNDIRLSKVLDALYIDAEGDIEIIHGAAPRGVDRQAGQWALRRHVKSTEFPAQWETEGKRAGPMRNIKMLKEGQPDFVVAFHTNLENSRGTKHMVSIAEKAGVKTFIVTE